MAAALDQDLRNRLLDAVLNGASRREAARRFAVSYSSTVRWVAAYFCEGRRTPLSMGGDRRREFIEHWPTVEAVVKERPDRTIGEIREELADRKIAVGHDLVWRWLDRAGLSFKKKTMLACEQKREDVARKRDAWREWQTGLAPERLVFVDETWTQTNIACVYGGCPKGQHLMGRTPHGHWKTITFLAALQHDRITAPCAFDGPINGPAFKAWTEQMLAPALNKGDIVILDNLSSHKGASVKEAIEARGAKLVYLPPYSPDLNPVQMVFVKLKALLRKAQRRAAEALWNEIGNCLEQFTPQKCLNYLKHAGYYAA